MAAPHLFNPASYSQHAPFNDPSDESSLASGPPAQSRSPDRPHCRGRSDRCPRHSSSWGAILAGVCLLALGGPHLAEAHGWLEVPASRNFLANGQNNFWEPMSLNRWVASASSSLTHTLVYPSIARDRGPMEPISLGK